MAKRVWIDNGGMVTCDKHSGTYMHFAIKQRPSAKRHTTPLGVYVADESGKYECETCVPFHMRKPNA